MKLNPDGSVSPVLRETRKTLLGQAPEGLSPDERELWWIVNWIQWKQRASEASEDFKIADPGEAERLRRKLPGLQIQAIQECREAIEVLERHLNEKSTLDEYPMGPTLWVVSEESACQIDKDLSSVKEFVDRLESSQRKRFKPSRIPSTNAMYIRTFWPLLAQMGFTMRRASRLLSHAFVLSGLSDHEQENSVYQTIRNLSV